VTITTTDTVQTAIVAALVGKTGAGDQVYSPRDWPVDLAALLTPMLMVQSPREHKESQGPNAPSYDVTATIRVVGRLTLKATANGLQAGVILAALAALQRQIEVAVINDLALYRIISEIVSVDTATEVKSEGNQPIGELTMDFVCKFYQGPEAFAQPTLTPIEELAIFGDLVNVFDPNGTYPPPEDGFTYPVADPPRESGPDYRAEIGAVVEIEQE
jgi:hypothetical protein